MHDDLEVVVAQVDHGQGIGAWRPGGAGGDPRRRRTRRVAGGHLARDAAAPRAALHGRQGEVADAGQHDEVTEAHHVAERLHRDGVAEEPHDVGVVAQVARRLGLDPVQLVGAHDARGHERALVDGDALVEHDAREVGGQPDQDDAGAEQVPVAEAPHPERGRGHGREQPRQRVGEHGGHERGDERHPERRDTRDLQARRRSGEGRATDGDVGSASPREQDEADRDADERGDDGGDDWREAHGQTLPVADAAGGMQTIDSSRIQRPDARTVAVRRSLFVRGVT